LHFHFRTAVKNADPYHLLCRRSNVKDINSILEVTVYDEDRDHKVEFLGKVAIPLLRVQNGEKKWYALKDKKLHLRAKGNSPQILLELTVLWNPVS
jgi:C2 domain